MPSMANVSIVIPCAPYHEALLEKAVLSCQQQTVPVDIIAVPDPERRGTGAARNRGLADVTSPYVVFLDADDTIAPDFVERCLKVIRPRSYIYTDWKVDAEVVHAPNCPFVNRTWHVVTTLLWTADIRAAGGFDEDLPAAEDSDLYLKLMTAGVCGLHLPFPLFTYGAEGERAKNFVDTPAFDEVMTLFSNRYGGKAMASCGSCGGGNNVVFDETPEGQPGDVLAYALWGGNRRMRGTITGRLYPRSGNGAVMMVDPQDGAAQPHLWQRVGNEDRTPPINSLDGLANALRPGLRPAPVPPPSQPAKATAPAPDFSKVAGLYQHSAGK